MFVCVYVYALFMQAAVITESMLEASTTDALDVLKENSERK